MSSCVTNNTKKINIVILHNPFLKSKNIVPDKLKSIIEELRKFGNVHNYWFKFSGDTFKLADLLLKNASKDIYKTFEHLDKYIIIALGHGCPFGLYHANMYPDKCCYVICYPFRYYSEQSLKRRIWKLKDNEGYQKIVKKYNIDDYMININDDRLRELLKDDSPSGYSATWYAIDYNFQKQYSDIPTVFKVPTILYTKLDLDLKSIIELNYDRTDIAEMKKIFSKNDAMTNSMVWNFDRVKHDAFLKQQNEGNDMLTIKYLISGWEDYQIIVDEIILIINSQSREIKHSYT